VLNPVAGTTTPIQVRRTIGAAFEAAGARCDFYETTGCDNFRDLIGGARVVGYNLVVAAGGDGTIADVADALVGTDLPLGIVPLGTGNILSMELGIPQNVQEAASLLVGDHEICQLDAMRVDGRHFFLQVGVGLDALMIRGTSRPAKRALGRLAYFITLAAK
jgi:diacylglycerol kinase family enzyme